MTSTGDRPLTAVSQRTIDVPYLIDHLFLPPQLPQSDDSDEIDAQVDLLRLVVASGERFLLEAHSNGDDAIIKTWSTMTQMLHDMSDVHAVSVLRSDMLEGKLKGLRREGGERAVLPVYIRAQNCGIIFRWHNGSLSFEFFQASPPAAEVVGTEGKLCIQFPSRARLSIPSDSGFLHYLAIYLAYLDVTIMPDAMPVTKKSGTKKAGTRNVEFRDVADIRYISDFIAGIARAYTDDTDALAKQTVYITKRIDDHVLFHDAHKPWGRSPKWLILRVALQTTLQEAGIDQSHRLGYKSFISYVLSRVLPIARDSDRNLVPSYILRIMMIKIAQRIHKLKQSVTEDFPFNLIADELGTTRSFLDAEWKVIREQDSKPLDWVPPTPQEIKSSSKFQLPNSGGYLFNVVAKRLDLLKPNPPFDYTALESRLESSVLRVRGKSPPSKPYLPDLKSHTLWVHILDLETWISTSLDAWVATFSGPKRKCIELVYELLQVHEDLVAHFKQQRDPYGFSRVFLTTIELWVALDKLVIAEHPLLEDFSPEFDISSLEPLLLSEKEQMIRLFRIEEYIRSRACRALRTSPSIFKFHRGEKTSFSYRYFRGNQPMLDLRKRINQKAKRDEQDTIKTLQRLNARYQDLTSRASKLSHEYNQKTDRWGCTQSEHSQKCEKCSLETYAFVLRCPVFEAPLPDLEVLSGQVVFELRVPYAFSVWRDATWRLGVENSPPTSESSRPPTLVLASYHSLKKYISLENAGQEITIASSTKSFVGANGKEVQVPAEVDDVIKPNPLHYYMYDKAGQNWMKEGFPFISIRGQCTPTIRDSPFQNLDWTLVGTSHAPNEVIARQSECKLRISYHEYERFGNLRAGHRLQWYNIALELKTAVLNLADPGVYILLKQAIWQAEKSSPSSQWSRESHSILMDPTFGMELIEVVNERLEAVKDNWQEAWTVACLCIAMCRLAHFTASRTVTDNATLVNEIRNSLGALRVVINNWITQIHGKLEGIASDATSSRDTENFMRQMLIQLTCIFRSSFALPTPLLCEVLQDRESLTSLIRSLVLSYDNAPSSLKSLPSSLRHLLQSDHILTGQLAPYLSSAALECQDAIDGAIRSLWSSFSRAGSIPWISVTEFWITCETTNQPHHVHLGLLTGRLLVNGEALRRLPDQIASSELVRSLFPSQSKLDVSPSSIVGMSYELRRHCDGFEVHFSVVGNETIVIARGEDRQVLEFVPRSKLRGDIPDSLLDGYLHIFHIARRELGIYPAKQGWLPSDQPLWILKFESKAIPTGYRFSDTSHHLVCPNSSVALKLYEVFRPLVRTQSELCITLQQHVNSSTQQLWVCLPAYRLNFWLNEHGDLESREISGHTVSMSPNIGTLYGLENKIVLRSMMKTRVENSALTKVIIPFGRVKCSPSALHSCIQVERSSKSYIYEVDDLLGRLVPVDPSVTAWLFIAYLHGVTTSHSDDPLTSSTGIKQAIGILNSPQTRSFDCLTEDDAVLLDDFLRLCPSRNYHPRRLRCMETISWPSNDSCSHYSHWPGTGQIDVSVSAVLYVLDYAKARAIFLPPYKVPTFLERSYKGSMALLSRATCRNAKFVPWHLDHELHDKALVSKFLFEEDKEQFVNSVMNLSRASQPDSTPIQSVDLWNLFLDWEHAGEHLSSLREEGASYENAGFWFSGSLCRPFFGVFHIISENSPIFRSHRYGLHFALATLAHQCKRDRPLVLRSIQSLLVIADNLPNNFRRMLPLASFELPRGYTLSHGEIVKLRQSVLIDRSQFTRHRLQDETITDYHDRCIREFAAISARDIQSVAQFVVSQWPTSRINWTGMPASSVLKEENVKHAVGVLVKAKFDNRALRSFSQRVQESLTGLQYFEPSHTPNKIVSPPTFLLPQRSIFQPLTLLLLFREYTVSQEPHPRLCSLYSKLERTSDHKGLSETYLSKQKQSVATYRLNTLLHGEVTTQDVQGQLRPRNILDRCLALAGLWPSLCPTNILGTLSFRRRGHLTGNWRQYLIRFCHYLRTMQQKRRSALGQASQDMVVPNPVWEDEKYVDRYLLEIDADILARANQLETATLMMKPTGGKNCVMQLNMGEGKSSVIVPLISSMLADESNLVRVVVLKPLMRQMFSLLKQRICGLLDRRIYFLPIHRQMPMNVDMAESIIRTLEECQREGGILLCQPEHILSFKLMSLDALCDSVDHKASYVNQLLNTQDWLHRYTRDILDESDEILSVKYQLIYTFGNPQLLQGDSERWGLIQQVLDLVRELIPALALQHPGGVDYNPSTPHDRFPYTRLLSDESASALLDQVAKAVVFRETVPRVHFRHYSTRTRNLALDFITRNILLPSKDYMELKKQFGTQFDFLLLLRGLIAKGVLRLALKEKRYRVDYGLDISRSLLAVPYRAKDSPASRAEYGHPDFTIVLTCLSYYYRGLTDSELELVFNKLRSSDNPELRYGEWVKLSLDYLVIALHSLRGINLDDANMKKNRIFPALRFTKSVIDFYLDEFVFLKEAKEFPSKLCTNAWDLAQQTERLKTGFSGTKDNSFLLPLTMPQLDTESQQHTNASVIDYLLQDKNHVCETGDDDALGLLHRLVECSDPTPTVLLDVGAQILELDNRMVILKWLELDQRTHIEAGIYFDADTDECWVLPRSGEAELLAGSMYRHRLQNVVVYLDEARTRGTDFKFPLGSRAVVTLGPKVTKDKLVQGCMRMRDLARTHCVTLFVSGEMSRKIRGADSDSSDPLSVDDVICFVHRETIAQLEYNTQLWANQGFNWDKRNTAWREYKTEAIGRDELKDALLEQEARTLEEMYGDNPRDAAAARTRVAEAGRSDIGREILQRCLDYEISYSSAAEMLEEQERELSHEKEDEREIERPPAATPLPHAVDPNLLSFIKDGDASGLLSAWDCLVHTSCDVTKPAGSTFFSNSYLFATSDFQKTIKLPSQKARSMNNFLRPVQWLVRNLDSPHIVLISPFEANQIMPLIPQSVSSLHVYAPRVSRTTQPLDNLDFATIGRRNTAGALLDSALIQELNLFAGQLFFANEGEYQKTCRILGVHLGAIPDEWAGQVDGDGFVRMKDAREGLGVSESGFEVSPVAFFKDLLRCRRKGQGFDLTHMGNVLNGNPLDGREFEV